MRYAPRTLLLLFSFLSALPAAAQTHTYQGYEIKLISVERTGKSEWKWQGMMPVQARKGGEIVLFRFSFKQLDPAKKAEAKFTRFKLRDAEGKECGEIRLMSNFGVHATHEWEIPFEVPRDAKPKTVALNDLVFDLEKIEKVESEKKEKTE